MNRVVKSFLLVSAAYLLGGPDASVAGREPCDPNQRTVDDLCQENGDAVEDASPMMAPIGADRAPGGGSG